MNLTLTRMLVAGTRASRLRLLGIAAGVMVGVALFLLLWGASGGLQARELRSTWTDLSWSERSERPPGGMDELAVDEVLASTAVDRFDGRVISRIDVVATAGSTVAIPGLPDAPAPGDYYASPAMAELIADVPDDQLGARYGSAAGVIADTALASPDSLVVVVGQRFEQVIDDQSVYLVSEFGAYAFANEAYRAVAIIGGVAVLVPVLLLIGIVTDLGAAERRERFATLRLIGATPGRVARIAATETAATGVVGAVAGVALFWMLVPLAARISINEGTFFAADLAVGPVTVAVVVVVTVVAATTVAWFRTLRAGIGPLGVTRQQQEPPPRFISVLPLLLGSAAMLTVTLLSLYDHWFPRIEFVLIAGFVLVTVGLLMAGPYLTSLVSRVALRRVSGAAAVIALGRIRCTPRATFRAVSGLVIAVFMVSVFAAAVTTGAADERVVDDSAYLPLSVLVGHGELAPAGALRDDIRAIDGVDGVEAAVVGYRYPNLDGIVLHRADAAILGLGGESDEDFVGVGSGYLNNQPAVLADMSGVESEELWPSVLLIATDGSAAAIERARTAAELSGIPFFWTPATRAESVSGGLLTTAEEYANLANLGILVATLVSAVSLAVSTTSSILDRRRVLGLLRLMGMPVATVRRVIVGEAALPLATVFGACIGLGFLVAWTILAGLTGGRRTVGWPDPSYYAILALSLLLALASVLATFRAARANTATTVTRFE